MHSAIRYFTDRPRLPGCEARRRWPAWPAASLFLLSACATLPQGYEQLRWADQRGDRGVGVAQRDLASCVDAVETRRSEVGECMAAHGWLRAP